MSQVRIVHYINQFFAGIGGEEVNDAPMEVRDGAVGPARAVQQMLGDGGKVVATIFAGDDYYVSNQEECVRQVKEALSKLKPDLVLAGPAFDAGRYGLACVLTCDAALSMGIPAVTGLHQDNAGISAHRRSVIAVPTGESPVEMGSDLRRMLALGRKLVAGETLAPADVEGYLYTGLRRSYARPKVGGARAVDMVLKRIAGQPFTSEIPARPYDVVSAPEPITSLRDAKVALITSAGIVPRGNPDQQSSAIPRRVMLYDIAGLDSLKVEDWESVHSGFKGYIYNTVNPNYALPLPAFREAERRGLFREIYPKVLSVVGGGCPVSDARRMGGEIARELKEAGVQAAVVAST